jgi:hypothetical protein
MFGTKENVEAGGLMSYSSDPEDIARRAAIYIDKILKGARPGDLPAEQASKYELTINLRTTRALAITIPPSVLHRADRILEWRRAHHIVWRKRHPISRDGSALDRLSTRSRAMADRAPLSHCSLTATLASPTGTPFCDASTKTRL